jgi:hypothetical protein
MSLGTATIQRIKAILESHYGIVANDEEIRRIDGGMRNNYAVLHDSRIVREIVSKNISEILLKHRTKENVSRLEALLLGKSVFSYLTYASMSYRAGVPIAAIVLCRTAMESGLREKIAEKRAARNKTKVLDELTGLMNMRLSQIERTAEEEEIINEGELQEIFRIHKGMKMAIRNPRQILDKYIHADFPAIISILAELGVDLRLQTPKDPLEEKKILAMLWTDKVAVLILMATTRLAERLYLTELTS